MKEILDWCVENWQILLYAICTLIIFICTVFRKKVKVLDTVQEESLKLFP